MGWDRVFYVRQRKKHAAVVSEWAATVYMFCSSEEKHAAAVSHWAGTLPPSFAGVRCVARLDAQRRRRKHFCRLRPLLLPLPGMLPRKSPSGGDHQVEHVAAVSVWAGTHRFCSSEDEHAVRRCLSGLGQASVLFVRGGCSGGV